MVQVLEDKVKKSTSVLRKFLGSQSYKDEFKELMLSLEDKYGTEFFDISGIGKQLDSNGFAKDFFKTNKNTADLSVDSNSNVSLKNIIIFEDEVTKPLKLMFSYYRLWKGLKKKYGVEYANEAIEKQLNGEIYINDFHGFFTNRFYCYNYSTLDTAMNGIPRGIDAEESKPTKYLNTFFEHLQLFCVHAGASSLGAVGLADLLLTVSAYADRILTLKSDQHFKFASEEDCWIYIKEKLTNFVYFLNQPNRIIQSLFSNVSIFDDKFLDSLISNYAIVDGETVYRAKKEIVNRIQDIFLTIMNETMSRRVTTFPVLTACISLDDDRNVLDEEFLKKMIAFNEQYCMINFYGGKTSSLSSCCFDGSQKVLTKSSNGVALEEIKNIVNGDYDTFRKNFTVFHNGSWCSAKTVKLLKADHKMFKIKTVNNKEMIVTDNHIHLTKDGDKLTTELTTQDYLAFNTRVLNTYPEADKKLSYEQGVLIGAYLGDGSKYKRENINSCEVTLSLSAGKLHLLESLTRALKDWNIDSELRIYDGQHNVKFVKSSSSELYDIINEYVIGNYAFEKALNPVVYTQSKEFRRGIFDGLYATDGGNSNRIYSTSKLLIEGMEALCTTLGINTIVNVDTRKDHGLIRGEKINTNYDVYCIRWYEPLNKRSMGEGYKVINNTEYFRVVSIEEVETDENYVYCFERTNEDEPYFTLPNGIITHNCRLRSDKENKYFSTLSGAGTKIGSIGVCTVNLPRLAYLSNGDTGKFKELFAQDIILAQRINGIKRAIIKSAIDKKMVPVYNLGYVLLKTQYSTLGINGLYEALEILGYNITEEEGLHFAENLLDFMNTCNDKIGDELEMPVNAEQIPAENVAVKLSAKCRMLGYNDKYEIYSNQFVPLTYTGKGSDLLTKIKIQGKLDKRLSGGSILHLNINEINVSSDTLLELIKAIYKTGTIYFAFNKLICECKDCGKIFTSNKPDMDTENTECPVCASKNIEYALRIVGFIRKFSSFSKGRRKEVKERVFYNSLEGIN